MRVAIFVLTSLAIASSEAGHTQAVEASDVPAFSGAISVIAMNHPGLAITDLAVPALKDRAVRSAIATNHASNLSAGAGQLHFNTLAASGPARYAKVPQVPTASVSAAGAPMAGRGAALIQPLTGTRSSGQPTRSLSDHLLTGLVAVMLIAYQLRRKHRVLRPHPFST